MLCRYVSFRVFVVLICCVVLFCLVCVVVLFFRLNRKCELWKKQLFESKEAALDLSCEGLGDAETGFISQELSVVVSLAFGVVFASFSPTKPI